MQVQNAVKAVGTVGPGELEKLRRPPRPVEKLKAERVQEKLAAMPGWGLSEDGSSIDRVRQFGSPLTAAAWAESVVISAGQEGHSVDVGLSGSVATVIVHGATFNGSMVGLTDSILDFANRLG